MKLLVLLALLFGCGGKSNIDEDERRRRLQAPATATGDCEDLTLEFTLREGQVFSDSFSVHNELELYFYSVIAANSSCKGIFFEAANILLTP